MADWNSYSKHVMLLLCAGSMHAAATAAYAAANHANAKGPCTTLTSFLLECALDALVLHVIEVQIGDAGLAAAAALGRQACRSASWLGPTPIHGPSCPTSQHQAQGGLLAALEHLCKQEKGQ